MSLQTHTSSHPAHHHNTALLTAETLITLYTTIGIDSDPDSDTIASARRYLEVSLPTIHSVETLAAVTLALVLVRSGTAPWAVERLRNASTTEDGEFGWVHLLARKRDAADWLYEAEGAAKGERGVVMGQKEAASGTVREPLMATVDEFKASLHALTTFCLLDDLRMAESAARYLYYRSHMLDAHTELLYAAVKAFALFDGRARDLHRSLTISLATSGMELTDTIELRPGRQQGSVLHLPSLPTKVFVYATGAGCATVQGRISYSSYAAKESTSLLDVWAGIVQEILPDRSSVEEIEGRSPMLKIKSCFRWKGVAPSGVLRLELNLFSGFELASTTPTLLDPHANLYTMEHGHRANQLWFVFANISANICPVCIQFLTRSIHIIASVRPGYVRLYPAGRADLAADMFFHTATGNSSLLNGISEDDLITWFGRNVTDGDSTWYERDRCSSTTEKAGSTSESTVEVVKDDVDKDATYTINVDDNSIHNLTGAISNTTDNVLIVPTALPVTVPNQNLTVKLPSFNVSDEIILQSNVPHIDEVSNHVDDDKNVSKKTTLSTTAKIIYRVIKLRNSTTATIRNESQIEKDTIQSTDPPKSTENPQVILLTTSNTITSNPTVNLPTVANVNATDTPLTTLVVNNSAVSVTQLGVDDVISQPKYVNTNTNADKVEIKYLPTVQTSEDDARTFAPEMKNDKYILLDKEELWGMLKEVVDSQIKSSATKTKSADVERLRRQGLS